MNGLGTSGVVRQRFAGTPQGWSIRRSRLLGLLRYRFGRLNVDFFLSTDHFLAANLHGLDTHNFVAYEANEVHILGRLTINPLFVLCIAIFLAIFLGRTAFGVDHHLAIHAHKHLVILDRILHLGRDGVEIGFYRRLGVKVEHRAQQIFELLRVDLRNRAVKLQSNKGAARVGIGITGGDGRRSSYAADFDALVPLLFLYRAAVDLENDGFVPNHDVADAGHVARLRRRAVGGHQHVEIFAIGSSDTLLQLKASLPHRERRANVNQFRVESADQVHTSFFADGRSLREIR